jgi:Holliday junction resolvase RusA-like endonuclease
MSTSVQFFVPLIPPSVNHYKRVSRRGGFFRTPDAIAFIDAVCLLSRKIAVEGQFYYVRIHYHLLAESFLRSDVDNFAKVSLDALTQAGVIRDDRYVAELCLVKRSTNRAEDARTEFLVTGEEILR